MISSVCWVPRSSIRPSEDDGEEEDDAQLGLTAQEAAQYRKMYEAYLSRAEEGESDDEKQDDLEHPGKGGADAVKGKGTRKVGEDKGRKRAAAKGKKAAVDEDGTETQRNSKALKKAGSKEGSGSKLKGAQGGKSDKPVEEQRSSKGGGKEGKRQGGSRGKDEQDAGQRASAAVAALQGGKENRKSRRKDKQDDSWLQNKAQSGAEGSAGKIDKKQGAREKADELLASLRMDTYDDDDDDEDDSADELDGDDDLDDELDYAGGRPKASVIERLLGQLDAPVDPEDDPYITLPVDGDAESSDESAAHVKFRENDCVIVATRAQDDMFSLEYWLYESGEDGSAPNLFVGAELMLPAFPLCTAWMGVAGGAEGSYVAVGTMDPQVEVFDINDTQAMEPRLTLVGSKPVKGGKKRRKLGAGATGAGHTAGVMSLAWNVYVRNMLASGSADKSVVLWDVNTCARVGKWEHHTGKVQGVAWHPGEPSLLLTGSYDNTVAVVDVRQSTGAIVPTWQVASDVEVVQWQHGSTGSFAVAMEDGHVQMYDARKGPNGKALFTLAAHDGAASGLSFCAAAPQLMVSASTDGLVKLWDVGDGKPVHVCAQNTRVGAVFALEFCADMPYLVGVGGAEGQVSVWDILATRDVRLKYGELLEPGVAEGDGQEEVYGDGADEQKGGDFGEDDQQQADEDNDAHAEDDDEESDQDED